MKIQKKANLRRRKTPEESVNEPTWSLRPGQDQELRKLMILAMQITGKSRQEVILDIVRDQLPHVVRRMLAEKKQEIASAEASLAGPHRPEKGKGEC